MNSYKSRRYRRMQRKLNYKNKILSILLISVMVFGMIPMQAYSTVDTSHSDNVEIKDENLEKALKEEIKEINTDYNNEVITKEDIKLIVDIDLSNKGIKSLEGIENAENLKSINLEGNEIKDISCLGNIKGLEKANINNQKIIIENSFIDRDKLTVENPLIGMGKEVVTNIVGDNISIEDNKIIISDISEEKEYKLQFKQIESISDFSGEIFISINKAHEEVSEDNSKENIIHEEANNQDLSNSEGLEEDTNNIIKSNIDPSMPSKDYMETIEFFGSYGLNIIGASNVYGCNNYVNLNKPTGTPTKVDNVTGDGIKVNSPISGRKYGMGGNSSKAVLKPRKNGSSIYKAYLISEYQWDGKDSTAKEQFNLPMTLKGPNGGTIKGSGEINGEHKIYRSSSNLVASVVTDVTEFVKQQGYGTYYGIDVPYYPKNSSAYDMVGGWKLIVIEESNDFSLRKVSIKLGSANISKEDGTNVVIEGNGVNFKKDDTISGELLVSSVGGDPDRFNSYLKLYSDYTNLSKVIDIYSNDPNTKPTLPGENDRPWNAFFQGIVSENGINRDDVAPIQGVSEENRKFYNTDIELLDLKSENLANELNHNASLMPGSSGIKLEARAFGVSGSLTAIGISADIDSALYEKSIKLFKGEAEVSDNNEVNFGDEFTMKASVKNISKENPLLGSVGSVVTVSIPSEVNFDESNIDVYYKSLNGDKIKVTSDLISIANNEIKIKFGENKNNEFMEQYGSELEVIVNGLRYKETVRENQKLEYSINMVSEGIVDEKGNVRKNPDGSTILAFSERMYKNARPNIMPDINLRKLINSRYLDKGESEGEPTVAELRSLNGIVDLAGNSDTLEEKKVENIKGLEYLTNAKSLNLGFNKISDISYLGGLSGLTTLNLNSNKLSNINTLNNLSGLTMLNLSHNEISDVSPLAGLNNLENLDLNTNKIVNINSLKGLGSLKTLILNNNKIVDISSLSTLLGLEILNLSHNEIGNVNPLVGLSNLENLDLNTNKIVNINSLKGLGSLKTLILNNNKIVDISSLSTLSGLKILNLSHNEISDISPIGGLTNLSSLDLNNNHIKDISSLKKLPKVYTIKDQTINIRDYINTDDFIFDNIVININGNKEENVWTTGSYDGEYDIDSGKFIWKGLNVDELNNLEYEWRDNNYKYHGKVIIEVDQVKSPDYMVVIPSTIEMGDVQDEASASYEARRDEKSNEYDVNYDPSVDGVNPIVSGQVGAKEFISITSMKNIVGNINIYTDSEFIITNTKNNKDKARVNVYKTFEEKLEGTAVSKVEPLISLRNNNKKDVFRIKAPTSRFKYNNAEYKGTMNFIIEHVK
ncbi:leucine-rich repeat domain-containing protein [Clostridium perfringens]|uniref:leucine-rich repeat domain-containing protein n=3 Tax=Clostridium perfringens TaxID=1502 RepID=UPI0010E1F831|nr:leucine-rich repeat domain-containing protein [Clostridium perfringens]NGT88228.1 leucine-rich repeat domain-containing protein [Clostridium perfringens]VTQ56190.1 Ig-like domain-containing surface protein [Clostridium perfringens]